MNRSRFEHHPRFRGERQVDDCRVLQEGVPHSRAAENGDFIHMNRSPGTFGIYIIFFNFIPYYLIFNRLFYYDKKVS
jgi:hypothetical protein